MISQFEQPIQYLQNCGYTPQASMLLLAEYYQQRAKGVSADEACELFRYKIVESKITAEESIYAEIKAFHKRLCKKGYKPEQIAEVVEAYYNQEEE